MQSQYLPANLFEDQVALITGAGSGINQAIAEMLAGHGAAVVLVGRNPDKLDATRARIQARGGRALATPCDVRDDAALHAAAAQGAETFGAYTRVVAGAAGNFLAPAAGMSANAFGSVVDIDLKGTFNTLRAAFEHFHADGGAGLVISAPQAQMPVPLQSHACAAKAGVESLVQTLALEWAGNGIRVNGLSPGYVEGTTGGELMTGDDAGRVLAMLPARRLATVEEMAQMTLMLLSPLAAYMTGQTLVLDGGLALLGGGALMQAVQGSGP